MCAVWLPGQRVHGLYEILEIITTGGMGLVYHVRHREWRIELAVKVPRLVSEGAMRDFETEAESWVGLGLHPHTVNCVYVRRLDGLPRVFAEWVDGGSLAEAVRSRRVYDDGLAGLLDIAIQSAWGLAHAHANGLVHQDVKPANVMLSADGTAKVTDFGLSRTRAERSVNGEPVSYGGLTPPYCSPEQARAAAGEPVGLTTATDVWSWAVTVLELFAGAPPTRRGEQAAAALAQLIHNGQDDPSIPVLPPGLADILARCFRPGPAERPPGMDDLAAELAGLYAEVTGETYARQRPSAARLLADGLSNQALSMLDLGRPDRAEELWSGALRADPHHPHTVYNRGLHRWRAAQLTDAGLVGALDEVRASHEDDWVDEYLLGLVHTERGDRAQAEALLAEATRQAPAEARPALETAQRLPVEPPPLALDGHAKSVESVAVSADGRIAATGGAETRSPTPPDSEGGTVCVWDLATGSLRHRLRAHARRAHAVALSADGSILASCGDEPEILVWETETGRLLHRLPGQAEAIAVSEDGRLLASAAEDGTLLVWDLANGGAPRPIQRPHQTRPYGLSVAIRVDRVVRWESGHVRFRVWDLETGFLLRSVQLPRRNAILSPRGHFALSWGEKRLELWATEQGELLRTLQFDEGTDATVLAVSDTGQFALARALTGLQVWDLDAGRCLRTLPHAASRAALNADGSQAVSADFRTAAAWAVPRQGPAAPWSYPRPKSAVDHSAEASLVRRAQRRADLLADDGRWAESAGEVRAALATPGYERDPALLDRLARAGRRGRRDALLAAWQVWEFPISYVPSHPYDVTGSTDRQFEVGPLGVYSLSHDGRFFLASGRLWDLRTGEQRHTFTTDGPALRGQALSPDGTLVVAGCEDRTIRIWDTETGRARSPLTGHPGEVDAVAFGAGGRLLLSGCRDAILRVWDLADGTCIRELNGHNGFVLEVLLSTDTRYAFARGFGTVISAWDVPAGRFIDRLAGDPQHLTPGMIDVDSSLYLAPGFATGFHATDMRTHEFRLVLPRQKPGDVAWYAVSANGRLAQVATKEGAIGVWHVASGTLARRLTGHAGAVRMLAPCADDRFTISCGADGTVRVWDLEAATCLRTLTGHVGEVSWIAVSGDARTVVSVGQDKTVRVWRLEWDFSFPDSFAGNEKARPYVEAFRTRRRWLGGDAGDLFETLADAGLGWLGTDAIAREAGRQW